MTMTPIIKPAIMDSHGKPGTAGSTRGVVAELVVELTVGVAATVKVDTDMLTTVVVNGLVVMGMVVGLDDVALLVLDTVIVAWVELGALVVVEVAAWPLNVGGTIGSR